MAQSQAIHWKALLFAGTLLPVTIATTAHAQAAKPAPPTGDTIAEVIVTAQRKSENLQRTPVAVSALSAETLKAKSVTQFSDLAKSVPGLSISTASTTAPGSALPVVYIRGIGQQDPSIFQDPGVGIYVDGVYVARSAGATIDLPDIGQVEVLRGPQGTLFGKNAVGGAINVTTQTPSPIPTGSLDATVGSYGLVDLRGVFSGPLASDLRGALAFNARRQDGYVDRLSYPDRAKTGSMGDQNHLSTRGRLRWTPSDTVTVDLSADYTRYRDTSSPGVTTVYPATNIQTMWNTLVAPNTPSGLPWTAATVQTGDQYSNFQTGPNFAKDDIYGVSASVSWDLPWATLRSVTAYRHVHETYSRDADGSATDYFSATGNHDISQTSQELQLLGKSFDGRLDWIGGLYYLHEDGAEEDLAIIAPGLYTATRNTALELGRLYGITTKTDSYAAFGQATFHATDALGFTVGLRYTSDDKSAVVSSFGTESGILYVPPTNVGKTFSALTPKFGVQYQATPDLLLYASATEGFKAGGFNGRVSKPEGLTTFQPEKVWSYEGGAKYTGLGGKLRANVAGYYMTYDNIQLAYFILTPTGVVNAVANVAGAQLHGAEAEVTALPFAHLELTATTSWEENKYTEIEPGAQVTKSNKIPYTPKWTASFSAQYQFTLPNEATLTPRIDYSFKGKTFSVISNSAPSLLPSYSLVNARVTYAPREAPWSLSVYGTNLADTHYFTSAQDNTTASLLYQLVGRPREYGVTLNARF